MTAHEARGAANSKRATLPRAETAAPTIARSALRARSQLCGAIPFAQLLETLPNKAPDQLLLLACRPVELCPYGPPARVLPYPTRDDRQPHVLTSHRKLDATGEMRFNGHAHPKRTAAYRDVEDVARNGGHSAPGFDEQPYLGGERNPCVSPPVGCGG